jgi:competence protein ComGC
MKPGISSQGNRALTLVEVYVIIVVLGFLAVMALHFLAVIQRRSPRIGCVSNLKQVNLSFRIWEGDNNDNYPMAVSVTNGGAMESVARGDVVNCFRVMSNELSTPVILSCPVDTSHTPAHSFGPGFNSSNISYFVGVDADESYPQRIMCGDDNFLINGSLIKSGLVPYPTNVSIAWSHGRHDDPSRMPFLGIPLQHHYCGNIGYADGSVAELSNDGLQDAFLQSDVVTNRLAIP